MKQLVVLLLFLIIFVSCSQEIKNNEKLPIEGTWLLISGETIVKEDTTFTDYTDQQKTIKIINENHFSFLRHDLNKGVDSTAVFVAGGGKYSLEGSTYTEHLEYCNFREWEDNTFHFEVTINKDTLIQKGIEKIEDLDVNQIIIETYVRQQ